MKIPLMNISANYSEIYDEVILKIENMIKATEFIGGKEIESFEKEYAEFCHTKYSVGAANGTDAIIIALKALGIGYGDTVLVPVNTFIATAEAVTAVGANVRFIDVEDEYYTIDPVKIEEYINVNLNEKIKAVIPVHLYGQMADMPTIMELAKKYKFFVIEDSAQAQGAELNSKRPAEYGDIATFSFYPGKNLGAFGDAGGMATNNENLYLKMKKLVNHGRINSKYEHELEGYNMRLDSMQAGILRIKLRHLEKWNNLRRENAKIYFDLLKSHSDILPKIRNNSNNVWYVFTVRVKNRDEIAKKLNEKGISTGIYYPIPLHLQPAYKHLGYKFGDFPTAEKHAEEVLSFPMFPELTKEQICFVVDNLKIIL
jgi:dTDP-4-amino-4,6-dideoxygalactose transaminase